MSDVTALPASAVGHLGDLDPVHAAVIGFLARYRGQTFTDYKHDMSLFLGWCQENNIPPLLITRAQLEFYIRWLQDHGWAQATVSRRFTTIASFYRCATMDDVIAKNPAIGVRRPEVDGEAQHRPCLTPVQFAMLLEAAREHSPTAHATVALLGMMGLRIAEACSLNVESIRVRDGFDVVTFRGKGGKSFIEPLPASVLRAVRQCIGDRTSGPLLTTRIGTRMDRKAAGRLLDRLAADAGMPDLDVSPHALRRTFCSSGLHQGVPLIDMQRAMRHARPETTLRYDRRERSMVTHAAHGVAAYLAGMAG